MKTHFLKLALAAAISLATQGIFAAETKVALVIGNSIYKDKELSLKNPVNDAKDMKAALEKVGFKVIYVENATLDQMDAVREEFRKSLDSDSLALFYYSGHGVQADGINYLIPSDAKIAAKSDLKRRAYDLGYFLDDMGDIQNRANIIIIDACRNNPFKSIRAIGDSKGLTAPTETPKGSIIAYATAPNSVASDNPLERNGIYTKYLKEYLFKPGLKIEDALKEVRKAVMKENDAQIPWENSSLIGDVCLAGCSASNVKPPLIPNEDAEGSPPLLSFVSGAKTVNQNKLYTFKVKASDTDKDLSLVQIDWGDGSELEEKTAKNNGILSFTHKYEFAGIYPLIALALDQAGNVSNEIAKSVSVKSSTSTNPVVTIPSLIFSDISSSSFELGDSVTFSATLSSALPTGYSVKIDYGNGLENMNSSSNRTSFTLGAMPSNSALYHIGIYDNAGKLQGPQVSGSFEVVQPVSESAPTLKLISASNSNEKGKVFTVTLQGSDADGNLSSVAIDWGDGKQDSQAASDGNSVIFNHVYSNAAKFSWSAVAYDDSGLSSAMVSQNINVNQPAVVNVVAPTIKQVSASPSSTTSGNAVTFAATLNSALPTGYKVKVDYGSGWNDMTAISNSANPNQLFQLLQTPKTLGLQTFKVGVFDSAGTLKGLAITGTFEIVSPAPVVIEKPVEKPTPSTTNGDIETFVSGSKTFSYTKIANDGSELPKTAKLGTGAKDWACTKDNNTGLIWEVKTDDGGLRDKDWTYTWYNPDSKTNGGFEGYTDTTWPTPNCSTKDNCNTYAFTNAVNKQGLCGAKDWRMPSKDELMQLVLCSDGKYDSDDGECTNYNSVSRPTINTTYFPNITKDYGIRSSSPFANHRDDAWVVSFYYGLGYYTFKSSDLYVQLVR